MKLIKINGNLGIVALFVNNNFFLKYQFYGIMLCLLLFVSCNKNDDAVNPTGVWEFTYAERFGIDVTEFYTKNPGYFLEIRNNSRSYYDMMILPKNNAPSLMYDFYSSDPLATQTKKPPLIGKGERFYIDLGFVSLPPSKMDNIFCSGFVTSLSAEKMQMVLRSYYSKDYPNIEPIHKFEFRKVMDGK